MAADRTGGDLLAEIVDTALELSVVGSFTTVGYRLRRRLFDWDNGDHDSLSGRVALVTGATSGLGRATAEGLARLGARVVVLGRDPERTVRTAVELGEATGREVDHVVADLSSLDEVRAAAAALLDRYDHLDVVVHNAGTLVHDHVRTRDGIELTAQVHVVAPFLLTGLLLPRLAATPDARVITVTSGGMYTTGLDVDALDHPPVADFDGVRAYARAKRAQVVLAHEWARRTAGLGVSFHAMHPGWASTAGLQRALPGFARLLGPLLRTPEEAVDTTLWLARSADARPGDGSLWLDRHRRRSVYLPGTSVRQPEADRLWRWCLGSAGLTDDPVHLPAPRAPENS